MTPVEIRKKLKQKEGDKNNFFIPSPLNTYPWNISPNYFIDDERASMDGPVSANMTYEEWLKTQPDDVVRDILGPTRFGLYKEGTPIESFVADGRTLTLEQLRERNSSFYDPVEIGLRELGPDYDSEKVKWFINRKGEKIESVEDEMRLIRELGIAANGKYEYLTLYANDGTIIHTQEGTEPGKINMPNNIVNLLLGSNQKRLYNVIHNHFTRLSFSLDDLRKLIFYDSLNNISAVGHNGRKYTMAIANGRKPTSKELEDFYTKKSEAYTSFIFDRKAKELPLPPDIDIRWFSGINKAIRNEYNWDYQEGRL